MQVEWSKKYSTTTATVTVTRDRLIVVIEFLRFVMDRYYVSWIDMLEETLELRKTRASVHLEHCGNFSHRTINEIHVCTCNEKGERSLIRTTNRSRYLVFSAAIIDTLRQWNNVSESAYTYSWHLNRFGLHRSEHMLFLSWIFETHTSTFSPLPMDRYSIRNRSLFIRLFGSGIYPLIVLFVNHQRILDCYVTMIEIFYYDQNRVQSIVH